MSTTTLTEAPVGVTSDSRRALLAATVASEVGGGWNVQSQTDYQAVLVRPAHRVHHLLHLALSVLTLGLWIPVWIFLAVVHRREKHKVVTVDVNGQVTIAKR